MNDVFAQIDLTDCIKVADCIVEKKVIKITRFKEADDNFIIKLVKDGIKIGEMTFLENAENKHLFIIQLTNYSIDAHTRERKYDRVGTSLINCAKKIAEKVGYHRIRVTAQTPFSTPLPKNHNLVTFYEKQGFAVIDNDGNDFYGYRMVFDDKKQNCLESLEK